MNLGLLQHGPQVFGNRAALQRTRRLSAKVKLVAPREIVDEGRAGQSRDAGGFVARPRGQRRRAEIMSEHRNARAVGNRLDVRARRLGAARVIEGDEFDGPAPDTALGVHFVDGKPRRDQAFRPAGPDDPVRELAKAMRIGAGRLQTMAAQTAARSRTAPMTPAAMTPAPDLDPQELGVTARPPLQEAYRIAFRSGWASIRWTAPAALQ